MTQNRKRSLPVDDNQTTQQSKQAKIVPTANPTPKSDLPNTTQPKLNTTRVRYDVVLKAKQTIDQRKLDQALHRLGLRVDRSYMAPMGKTWKIKFSNGIIGFNKAYSSRQALSDHIGHNITVEAFQPDYTPPPREKPNSNETQAILRVRKDIEDGFTLSELKTQFENKVLKATRIINSETQETSIFVRVHCTDKETATAIIQNGAYIGSFKCKAEPPKPRPTVPRCGRCHDYGHNISNCKSTPKCGKCSSESHNSSECTAVKTNDYSQAKCPNCAGNHTAWSHFCPKYRTMVKSLSEQNTQRQTAQINTQQQTNQLQKMTQSFAQAAAKNLERTNDAQKTQITTCIQESTETLKSTLIAEAKQMINEQLSSFKSEIQDLVNTMIGDFKTELLELTHSIKQEFSKEFLAILDPTNGLMAEAMRELRHTSQTMMFHPKDGIVTKEMAKLTKSTSEALAQVRTRSAGAFASYDTKTLNQSQKSKQKHHG